MSYHQSPIVVESQSFIQESLRVVSLRKVKIYIIGLFDSDQVDKSVLHVCFEYIRDLVSRPETVFLHRPRNSGFFHSELTVV